VSGRVQRRQAERFAERDASIAAEREQAYEQTIPRQAGPPPSVAPVQTSPADTVEQLKDLADLREQGVLTEAEFAAQKAKILGG
jgi:hypothetical protein